MKDNDDFKASPRRTQLSCTGLLLLTPCFFSLLVTSADARKAAKKAQIKYEGHVEFASEFARVDNICIQFGGSMTAGSFFQDLQVNASAKGTEYSKDGRRLETFPQNISAVIIAVPRMCDRQPDEDLSAQARDFMDKLEFDASWKLGFKMQKAKGLNREKTDHDLEELPLLGPGALADVWKYRMTLSGEAIPLNAHLIVSVFDKERRLVARLSARL